nr:CoA transferase [Fodinicola feengrottensis]
MIDDTTLAELGTVVEVEHPERGTFKTVGSPLKLSDSPVDVQRSPLLGEHNEEVLSELGYSGDRLKELRAAGVI